MIIRLVHSLNFELNIIPETIICIIYHRLKYTAALSVHKTLVIWEI